MSGDIMYRIINFAYISQYCLTCSDAVLREWKRIFVALNIGDLQSDDNFVKTVII